MSPQPLWWGPSCWWRQTFKFVHDFADLALSRLFEPPCAACGATLDHPLDGAVCELCWSGIHRLSPPVCNRCGDPLPSFAASMVSGQLCRKCQTTSHAVDRMRAIGAYEGRLRDIIHALKYDGRRSVAPRLASMMRMAGAEILETADCIVPVPLHSARERSRGFNQAEDLARTLGLPVTSVLQRVRATRPQIDLPAADRHRNVKDAFGLRPRPRPAVQGLVIVLVDDVSTTGATLDACASVLKAAGAKSVCALTAARVASGPR